VGGRGENQIRVSDVNDPQRSCGRLTNREPRHSYFLRRALSACPFANGLVTSRAHSMKRRPSGLSVRFLSVMTPICRCVVGSSTGNTLRDTFLPGALMMYAGMTARKRPFAASLVRIL